MALSLSSQRISIPKSNPSSVVTIPNAHKKKHNFTTIKAESRNGDHLQRVNIKTPQQKQPIKRRIVQSAPIGLWDSFPTARTVQQMMDTMETLMEEPPFYRDINCGSWGPQGDTTSSYIRGRTPWEIKEGEQDYKMRFDMPGMTKEDVKVWVEEKMMVVKAEKVKKDGNENGESNGKVVADGEWSGESYGKYSFRIALPENVEFEKIKAEVKDGVLYATIPKVHVASKILDINVQ